MTAIRLPVIANDAPALASPGPAAPPWPHLPTVEWQVCGTCNYDCSYCIQSPAHRQGQPSEGEVDRMLAFLAALPGTWQIKMTGGEPFASRLFLPRVIPGLLQTRHRLALLTNLSPPAPVLARFARATHGRLDLVSASLHLEHTSVEAFLQRLEALRAGVHADTRLVVNCVLVPGHLREVRAARDAVVAAGVRFFPQLMKVKNGVFAYNAADRAIIDDIVGGWERAERLRTANLAPAYSGRRCWAGARYLVLTQDGKAWSCRSARRHGEGLLGDVHAGGVQLRPGPTLCPYPICPCAVPANRGMIEGMPARELPGAHQEPA